MARPKLGPGATERFHMAITTDEITAIDDWRYANRVATRSKAVRTLVAMGLATDDQTAGLMSAAKKVDEYFDWLRGTHETCWHIEEMMDELKAAIAKAEGTLDA